MKKIYFFVLTILCLLDLKAQTVSTFMETSTYGCYGLAISNNFLYVVSSFDGTVHRKNLTAGSSSYETFSIGANGYSGICKIGDFVYVSKPYNGVAGIYRFNPDQENFSLQNFMSLNNVYGLTHRNSELYISASDKIYKVNLNSSSPSLVQIANNINGTAGFNGSSMGLKIYDGFLYISESSGISRINLDSGNFEKEIITTHTGNSFAKGDNGIFYLTSNNIGSSTAIYKVDIQTQASSLLLEIDDFIGTYDIVFSNNSLYVTTLEGNYNQVARVDLNNLETTEFNKNTIVLYPNPTSDFINLKGINPGEDVTIINTNGKTIKSVKVDNGKIDVSSLEAGIYFIKNKNVYSKFLKKQ